MHTAGLMFLWINRLYFTLVVVFQVSGGATKTGVPRSYARAQTVVSIWQIIGTFVVVALNRSPLHLIWWYPTGWALYGLFGAIWTDVRRMSSGTDTDLAPRSLMNHDTKGEDKFIETVRKEQMDRQMFDPPIEEPVTVAGRPLLFIPNSDIKYANFVDWWMKVGRKLSPNEDHGWQTLSGPWVMRGRTELIPAEDWNALEQEERDRITAWVNRWPIGMFYD